ncbi:MAG TPA: P1 family peptidase [Bacillota bacterium]|jgi:D-aminopeptidase
MRLREAGITLEWQLEGGRLNAITDVPGVLVGHDVLDGDGDPAARTGVTVVRPHPGSLWQEQCRAGVYALNGAGEMAGWLQIQEHGLLQTPIWLTGTAGAGRVYDAAYEWMLETNDDLARDGSYLIPCVSETCDHFLNDIRRYRAGRTEVRRALEAANGTLPAEGGVGAGRGMICYEFKGGIGTASRRIPESDYTVGALTLCNFGHRQELTIGGVRVGERLKDVPKPGSPQPPSGGTGDGSIVMVIATDAPVLSHELRRLAKRASLAVIRTGSVGHHNSGDLSIAFSTANLVPKNRHGADLTPREIAPRPFDAWLFTAAIEATEEAILNALCQAETTTGQEGRVVHRLPVDRLREELGRERPALVRG